MKHIHSYYSPGNLYKVIIDGIKKTGKDPAKVTLEDLQAVDEFHIRGTTATKELMQISNFTSDMHILDVGCGIGGSTRRLSYETGCRVTGIDLSDEYIDVAEKLTRLLSMQDRVNFTTASALALPFENETFDGIWSIQMNMNIDNKLLWLTELYRVLKPTGRAVLYEVCGGPNSPIHYPVPWAQDDSMSFLVSAQSFHDEITNAGFDIGLWSDKTSLAREAFANMTKPEGEPKLPDLGVHMLVGNDILTKAYNLHRNLEEDRVTLIESVSIKPSI